ncbi:restriction system protein [Variovorax soli]|uniref:Restriction system protein n=2 Tax=Variovorax soli TaxID=376815 RepID=A0ABU1NLX5_9BURK|nr:restriction system protein [Variovorax soli]
MARRNGRGSRATSRRNDGAIKMMALGAAFVVMPMFLSSSPMFKALSGLWPIGLLLIAAGGLVMWLNSQGKSDRNSRVGRAATANPSRTEPFLNSSVSDSSSRAGSSPKIAKRSPEGVRIAEDVGPQRPTSWSAAVFDAIEWRRFEALVETLFQQVGFHTRSQTHGADGGVDIWLSSPAQPEVPLSLIQCKHWYGKKVGVDKIREFRGAMASFKVPRGQYATTSTFTPDAVSFARENGIHLLDGEQLLALIDKRLPDQQQALLEVALEGEYWRPTCVNCGVKMVNRSPKGGGKDFWGCVNFPRCKTTMPIRGALER